MKSVDKKNAFTIVQLLVATTLLVILLRLPGMVFNTTVAAHRAAGATIEITRNLRAITDQFNTDFQGLRKDGEILLAWVARPAIDENGNVIDDDGNGIPDTYQKFDRIIFFADGDFQTYQPQQTLSGSSKIVHGNLARVSYMLAKDNAGTKAADQPNRAGRILARTEHIVTADADLPPFPDWTATLDPVVFEDENFRAYEYQTTTMGTWTAMSQLPPTDPGFIAKNDILTILSDIQNILAPTAISNAGPTVDFGLTDTYRNLDGTVIHQTAVGGVLYPDPATGAYDLKTNNNMKIPNRPLTFTALKFTFTLYDSMGIIPGGKTFTHIVYINN